MRATKLLLLQLSCDCGCFKAVTGTVVVSHLIFPLVIPPDTENASAISQHRGLGMKTGKLAFLEVMVIRAVKRSAATGNAVSQ